MKRLLVGMVAAALLSGCTDYGYTQKTQQDFFVQNRINTVDVLVVVDNSCSMVEEQGKLSGNFDSFIEAFETAEVSWQIGVITTDTADESFSGRLQGGDDEIILTNESGNAVDQVIYDADWGLAEGVVLSLDPSNYATIRNDDVDQWCASDPSETAGTPGELNPTCTDTPGLGQDDAYGAVVITEFLADPLGVDDDLGEWVELTNVSAADVALDGWTLSDRGRNLYTFPDGAVIAAGGTYTVGRTTNTATNGGLTVDAAVGADFTLNNDVLILTQEVEGASEIFGEMIAQGTTGAGIEMGLEAASLALAPELLEGHNAGLIRDEANLSIVMVSDEEDSSPESVDTYLRQFADLKGDEAYRDHTRMSVSSVVGNEIPEFEGEPSCSSSNGVADYGARYVYATLQTGGLLDSICDEDFSPMVAELGLTLSGLEVEFALSRVPVVESLAVEIYEEGNKLKDLTIDVDYTYDEAENRIIFALDQIPESEQTIVVSYTIRSGAA